MINRRISLCLALGILSGLSMSGQLTAVAEDASVRPSVAFIAPATQDQDDGCVWLHPHEPGQSTVIASDKSAGRVFVFDLDGRLLQEITVTKPGNIDIRHQIRFGGETVDLVVVNQRADGFKLVVFRVDPQSRKLERLEDDHCTTGPNYGGCLYHSRKSGRLFFFCTSETGSVGQYELKADGDRGVTATKVRTLEIGKCEGAVAADASDELFIAEEKKGVWKFSGEPDGPAMGELVVSVGKDGLKGDVEGLALYQPSGRKGAAYLLVSDQGRNRFMVYRGEAPHNFVAEFSVEGAVDSDGIDVCPANLGPQFPEGMFVCHTGRRPRGLLATPWQQIAKLLSIGR